MSMSKSKVTVEWAPFTVAAGVTDAELLQAAAAVQADFLARQDGFLRRELLQGEGAEWCDVIHWRDPESAERAMQIAAESPVCHRYFALMVLPEADPGAGVRHFALRASFAG